MALVLAASAACVSLACFAQQPSASHPVASTLDRTTSPTASPLPESAKIRLTRKSADYWRVTLANPPLNIIGPSEVRELVRVLEQIEADPRVKVVVFDSAVPGYFCAHYDLLNAAAGVHRDEARADRHAPGT
jgi:hypothetical protein